MTKDRYPLLELEEVRCGRGRTTLVRDVNMSLAKHSVNGLIGPNGAGKSTLIATIVGDIKPIAGAVKYQDKSVRALRQRSGVFGVVTESHGIPPRLKVGEVIRYWSKVHGISRSSTTGIVDQLGVGDFWDRQVRRLSTGMRRRMELALALLPDPRILVLDEPFNGLDIDGVNSVRELIREQRDRGKSILLATHTLSEIDQLADRLYAVHQKQVHELQFSHGEPGASELAYQALRRGEEK